MYRIVAIEAVAFTLVGRDQQVVWVFRIDLNIDDARLVVNVQNLVPGFSAVGCFVQAAFFVGPPKSSQGSDPNYVRVLWVNGQGTCLKGFFQTHVLPGLATVG